MNDWSAENSVDDGLPTAGRGVFLSDLHLFSRRSVAPQLWLPWERRLPMLDLLVLGGDIFDFRWSQSSTKEDALLAAKAWLEKLLTTENRPHVHYLLGNHDCLLDWRQMLAELQAQHPGFDWSDDTWRLGSRVFLHGDVLDAGLSHAALAKYRQGFEEERNPHPLAHHLYDAAVFTRLHRYVPSLIHGRNRVCRKLITYLDSCQLGKSTGIEQVYFGHTHLPILGHAWEGLRFYNAGSGVRHLRFEPHVFEFDRLLLPAP